MKDHPHQHQSREKLRNSFRRGLDTYHAAAVAQKRIAGELVEMLQTASGKARFGRVFEFGCGTGHLTEALLDRVVVDQLILNDLVEDAQNVAMPLAQAHCQNVGFLGGAIEHIALPADLDLAMSASSLQWVADGPRAVQRLCDRLKPRGWLALSSFGTSHFHELVALGSNAAAPNYSDADTLASWLPAGVDCVALQQVPVTLQFPNALQLLRHLRDTGVNARSGQAWSRGQLGEFETQYRAAFGQSGALPLTYDAVWMVARKS